MLNGKSSFSEKNENLKKNLKFFKYILSVLEDTVQGNIRSFPISSVVVPILLQNCMTYDRFFSCHMTYPTIPTSHTLFPKEPKLPFMKNN